MTPMVKVTLAAILSTLQVMQISGQHFWNCLAVGAPGVNQLSLAAPLPHCSSLNLCLSNCSSLAASLSLSHCSSLPVHLSPSAPPTLLLLYPSPSRAVGMTYRLAFRTLKR